MDHLRTVNEYLDERSDFILTSVSVTYLTEFDPVFQSILNHNINHHNFHHLKQSSQTTMWA